MYRKSTHTGLLTNYNSFTSLNYKKGLIKRLFDQTFRINSTWCGFHYDILNLKSVLQKNEFPLKLINKSISKYFRNNVLKQKENEQMLLLESSKSFTNYHALVIFLFRRQRNLITLFQNIVNLIPT